MCVQRGPLLWGLLLRRQAGSSGGTEWEIYQEVPEDYVNGYAYAIATGSTTIMALYQQRCLEKEAGPGGEDASSSGQGEAGRWQRLERRRLAAAKADRSAAAREAAAEFARGGLSEGRNAAADVGGSADGGEAGLGRRGGASGVAGAWTEARRAALLRRRAAAKKGKCAFTVDYS
jgi:hypothetical protein